MALIYRKFESFREFPDGSWDAIYGEHELRSINMMESDFLYLVETELVKAREKHTVPIHTPHEAYGVIAEEVAEFFDEVRRQQIHKGTMLRELIQIAAMCYRSAEDLGLLAQVEPEVSLRSIPKGRGFHRMICHDCERLLGRAIPVREINYKGEAAGFFVCPDCHAKRLTLAGKR